MSWPLIKYVLTAAVRDRVTVSFLVLLLLGASLSVFLGSAAVIEQDQFSLVFAAGGLRLAGVLALVLFVVFLMRRMFEAKDIEFLLSRPIGRVGFLVSYSVAFSFLALLMGVAQGGCLYVIAPHLFDSGHVLWIVSVIIENIIMVNVALFFSMVLTSATVAALASFSFYVLGRMMGEILGIIDAGTRIYNFELLEGIMQLISAIMPRLDLLGQTSWLLYGVDEQIGLGFVIVQGLVFTALVVLASLIDLVRRQF